MRLAVALDHVAADAEIVGQEAPGLAVPVHAGAADAVAGQEAAPFADRQRRLRWVVAHGQRFLLRTQEHVVTNRVAQLVRRGADVEIGGGVAPRAALDRDHFEAGARELVSQDRSGPAETDDDDILARETAGHQLSSPGGAALQADRRQRVGLVRLIDHVAIVVASAGKADELPARHVAIAAIDRIGEVAFDGVGVDGAEQHPAVEVFEFAPHPSRCRRAACPAHRR